MLARVVRRAQRATGLNDLVVATTIKPLDDPIISECRKLEVPAFRGSEADVLDRYYRTARAYRAEGIVRITADCPLIDPGIIDLVVQVFLERQPGLDYAANFLSPRTFPRGLDTEVMHFAALERAWHEDRNPAWREHVDEFILHHPDSFTLCRVANDVDYSHLRWTVDTPEDMVFARKMYGHFDHDHFPWREVLRAQVEHPEWTEINRNVQQKEVI